MKQHLKNRNLLIGFIVSFLFIHFYLQFLTQPKDHLEGVTKDGQIFPFAGQTLDGQSIDLTTVAANHKLVVINFWETWCGPCLKELPYLQKIYSDFSGQGLEMVGIFQASEIPAVKKMLASNNISYIIIHDVDKKISRQFRVTAIPVTIVLDENLKVLRSHQGIDLGLHDFISSYLKEKKS